MNAGTKKLLMYGFGIASVAGASTGLAMEFGREPSQPDEFSKHPWGISHMRRGWFNLKEEIRQTYIEPSQPVLLPPPMAKFYGPNSYTLVVELTGVLVKPEWTYKTGWRFKKRPHIDYFLQQCGPPTFELVVYTQENGFTAYPVIDALDQHGLISYRLFRDSTKYMKGTHVKELSQLGRDMKRVIHIDWNEAACQTNPDNCFVLKKWDGDSSDRTLVELSDFIREIANLEVDDVRQALRYYKQFEDPLLKFKENQKKAEEMKSQGLTTTGGRWLPSTTPKTPTMKPTN